MCTRKILALNCVTFCLVSLICLGVSFTPNKNLIQYLESNQTITSQVSVYLNYALYSICISLVSSIFVFILSIPCNFYSLIFLSSLVFSVTTIVITVLTIIIYFMYDSSATVYNFISIIIYFITTLLLLCFTASAKGLKDNTNSRTNCITFNSNETKSNESVKEKKQQKQQTQTSNRDKILTSLNNTVIPAVTHTLINGSITNQPLSSIHYDDQLEQSRSASRRPSTPRPQLPGSLVNSRPATPAPPPITEVVYDEPVTSSSLTRYKDTQDQSPPLTPPPLEASLQDPFRQRVNNP